MGNRPYHLALYFSKELFHRPIYMADIRHRSTQHLHGIAGQAPKQSTKRRLQIPQITNQKSRVQPELSYHSWLPLRTAIDLGISPCPQDACENRASKHSNTRPRKPTTIKTAHNYLGHPRRSITSCPIPNTEDNILSIKPIWKVENSAVMDIYPSSCIPRHCSTCRHSLSCLRWSVC